MQRVFIASAKRSPIGRFQGQFKNMSAVSLGTQVAKAAISEAKLDPGAIEEAIFGQVLTADCKQSPTRQVVLNSGCKESTEALTINKVCASGLKAVSLGSQQIQLGLRDCVLVGGMESMSNVPFYVKRQLSYGHQQLTDGVVGDGLTDAFGHYHMGVCGEKTSKDMNISREEQDAYAISSYERALSANSKGQFQNEMASIEVPSKKTTIVDKDEELLHFKPDKFPLLKPAFDKQGTITAANASKLNDGAAALILVSERFLKANGMTPLAEIVGYADGARSPIDFPIAPAIATPKALEMAKITKEDVNRWEINEAFSCVALANMSLMGLSHDKVNPSGGAVSLGHPIGASGARILCTLVHQLEQGYGVASICNGGGAATALVVKK